MDRLKPIERLTEAQAKGLVGIFTDVDDTLTHDGRMVPSAFMALQRAHEAGLRVVPITGRPGGWVDLMARMWPVDGVVGENGGLWFYRHGGRMHRRFLQDDDTRRLNRARLDTLARLILREVPGSALASDQSYRDLDLAIDFCEDVPRLTEADIDRIVELFEEAGATCKVSSIHVNGWFGDFDKLTGCAHFVQERWGESLHADLDKWLYMGDSANDEPMFKVFPLGTGVANVRDFLGRMTHHPSFITEASGGEGFTEAVDHILRLRGQD